jgi:hypothetical protein
MKEHINYERVEFNGQEFVLLTETKIEGKVEGGKIAGIELAPHLLPYNGAEIRVTIERL